MTDQLPSNLNHQNLTEFMGIDPKRDTFEIRGGAGLVFGMVKKSSGQITTIRATTDNAFSNITHFDATNISIEERRKIEASLYSKGFTQVEIAEMVGLKQSTVSHDIRLLANKDKGENNE